ncbi:MAG: AraC family transcriptional regulator [Pseudomonas sp.]|uniref:AraC family transcriptional regulator n=1 Tax=Pseudomonas sp. TaxID=306 RepID=UPI0033917A66
MAGSDHRLIGAVEVARFDGQGQRFAKHSHEEFVISANLLGHERVWLDGRNFDADAGTLTTYNPGQIQGGGVAEGQPWRFVSLYLPPELLVHSLGLAYLEFARPALRSPWLVQRLAQAVEHGLSADAFVREGAEEQLLVLLGELVLACGVRIPASTHLGNRAVTQVKEWLAAQLDSAPSLEQMALLCGLSKFQLLRAFQKDTGLSPRQWAMQLRTRRAQGLLRQGRAVTEIAQCLGFVDQSHLTRHFRAAYGLPPGQYQRAVRG